MRRLAAVLLLALVCALPVYAAGERPVYARLQAAACLYPAPSLAASCAARLSAGEAVAWSLSGDDYAQDEAGNTYLLLSTRAGDGWISLTW